LNLKESYRKKSLDIFSGLVEPHLHHFEGLKPNLIKANIKLSLKEYVCMAVMTIALVFVIEMPLLAFILAILPQFTIPVAILMSLTLSLAVSGLIAFLFYLNPSIKASSRGEDLDHGVPFAATYLATIAGSGINPTEMFKILSDFESYKSVSEEAKKITTKTELLGMTITEALAKTAKESPSERFSKLLWGMVTTIRSGADLHAYLHERSRELMRKHERDLEEYSRTLGTFLQMYLTLIVVGSIFTIIITSIMSAFGLGPEMAALITVLQFSVVFLFLPVITVGFIWLVKTTYPG